MNVAFHPDTLNLISICAGGGGLDLGVELAIPCARTVCMVEREAFAVATLVSAMEAGLLAPAPVWSDARTFDGRAWRGAVDGLIGGIPCQPHSVAGRKRGSHDARDLWSVARRIIVQSGAWFVLIENVAGMLTAGADEIAGAERVWRDLRKLGFAVEIGLFRASEVGAPHERERVFILGVADDARRRRRSGASAGPGRGGERPDRGGGSEPADANGRHAARRGTGCSEEAGGRTHAQPSGSGEVLAHAGSERGSSRLSGQIGPNEEGHAGEPFDDSNALGNAEILGRREGWPEPIVRRGRDAVAGAGSELADTDLSQLRGEPPAGQQQVLQRDDAAGLFPRGPADIDGWREILAAAPHLEPAVCGLADGLAAARIDWLRLLGNGVVPLQAAYAIRTLATRLAARGAGGADRLVRMMDQQPY